MISVSGAARWPGLLTGLIFPLFAALCPPALAQEADYGPHGLIFKAPAGFVDSQTISDLLFDQTLEQAGLDGVLLKIYLPDEVARLYADNGPEAVTSQICLYGVNGSQDRVLERRATDLMFASLLGAYANFTTLPDSTRRDRASLEDALRNAARNGENLLIENLAGDLFQGYLSLVSYRIADGFFLSTAMCTAVVPVADTVVLLNISSIITDDNVPSHVTWVRDATESFAAILVSANQNVQF